MLFIFIGAGGATLLIMSGSAWSLSGAASSLCSELSSITICKSPLNSFSFYRNRSLMSSSLKASLKASFISIASKLSQLGSLSDSASSCSEHVVCFLLLAAPGNVYPSSSSMGFLDSSIAKIISLFEKYWARHYGTTSSFSWLPSFLESSPFASWLLARWLVDLSLVFFVAATPKSSFFYEGDRGFFSSSRLMVAPLVTLFTSTASNPTLNWDLLALLSGNFYELCFWEIFLAVFFELLWNRSFVEPFYKLEFLFLEGIL